MDRRTYLSSLGAALFAAGCVESGGGSTDDTNGSHPDSSQNAGLVAESYTYQHGDRELVVTPTDVNARDLLVYSDDGRVHANDPGDEEYFLLVTVEFSNTGELTVDTPDILELLIDNERYEPASTAAFDSYTSAQEIRPGVTTAETLLFEVPTLDSECQLFAEWQLEGQSETWDFDLSAVDRDEHQIRGLNPDDSIELRADGLGFRIALKELATVDSYEYTHDGETHTDEPAASREIAVITVTQEAIGDGAVTPPSLRDVSLDLDIDTGFDNRVDVTSPPGGGQISCTLQPGEVCEVEGTASIPEDATIERVLYQLGYDTMASWNVQK